MVKCNVVRCNVVKYNVGRCNEVKYNVVRVVHSVLLRSECIVLLHSFKDRNVLFRSFFKVFGNLLDLKERCILLRSFLKNIKNAKNARFFCKER